MHSPTENHLLRLIAASLPLARIVRWVIDTVRGSCAKGIDRQVMHTDLLWVSLGAELTAIVATLGHQLLLRGVYRNHRLPSGLKGFDLLVNVLALGMAPSAIFKRMGLTAEQIRVLDSYTVEYQLSEPFGPFRVAIPLVSIANPVILKAHEQDGDWGKKWLARNEAGSGASDW